MSTPYIGEIRTVGFNFTPVGWLPCEGQLLSISEYDTLFMLLGTTYGGDGQTTFALPDMRGRVHVAAGTGPGLSTYVPGQRAGSESVTLISPQMPMHAHPFTASLGASTAGTVGNDPAAKYPSNAGTALYATGPSGTDQLAAGIISGSAQVAGGSQPHSNIQPVIALNVIISYQGIFPPQQ